MKKKLSIIFGIWFLAGVFLLQPSIVRAATNPCDNPFGGTANAGNLWKMAKTIDPIVPKEFRGYKVNSETISSDPNEVCLPAYWNLTEVKYFIFKAIHLLNWLALALAIILIIYSGILYISGYAVEANVKKAKSTLIATLTGLVIVFAARYIIDGAFILFSDNAAQSTVRDASVVPIGQ